MEILRLPVLPDMRNPVAVAYPSGPSAGAVVRSPDPDSAYCNPQLQYGSDRQPVFDAIEAVVELVAQIAEITYRIFRRLTGARQGAEKR